MSPAVTDVTDQYKLSREVRHGEVMNDPSQASHFPQNPRQEGLVAQTNEYHEGHEMTHQTAAEDKLKELTND